MYVYMYIKLLKVLCCAGVRDRMHVLTINTTLLFNNSYTYFRVPYIHTVAFNILYRYYLM